MTEFLTTNEISTEFELEDINGDALNLIHFEDRYGIESFDLLSKRDLNHSLNALLFYMAINLCFVATVSTKN